MGRVPARGSRIAASLLFLLALAACLSACRSAAPMASASPANTYWCPMHPGVRGSAGGSCPLCGMALVPAPSALKDSYLLDVEIVPHALLPGQTGQARFTVREREEGTPVRRFEIVHDRLFHLFVLSHDLEYFAHVHPQQRRDGTFDLPLEVPRPGPYRLIADFLPVGAAPQLVQKTFVTGGYRGPLRAVPALAPDVAAKTIEGTTIDLTVPKIVPGEEQLLTFDLRDASSGRPIDDLEPYLGATGHLLLVNADLSVAFHSHPVAGISTSVGPTVVFQVLFPKVGHYRMWAQFQRHGRVVTAPFTVRIPTS